MRRLCGLTCLIVLTITATALGRAIAPPPLTQRLAVAEVVVVGRVTGMEDMDVEAVLVPNGAKQKARIALVTVSEILQGPKDLKNIKVAFPAAADNGGNPKRYLPTVNLQTGREYLLLLGKDASGKFFVCTSLSDAVERPENGANFDKDVTLAKRCLKFLAEPKAGLTAKDTDDRLMTAALLIQKYRGTRTGNDKQEPIAAEESKLILTVLKDSQDWNKFDPTTRTSPQMLFQQLGLEANDGWTPPASVQGQDYQKAFTDAARAWLGQNADKYRIQRLVPATQKAP